MKKRTKKMPPTTTSAPVVENQTPVCFCGRRGIYTGCSPAGVNTGPLRIAFKCDCGKVWGFLAPRADLERYRS